MPDLHWNHNKWTSWNWNTHGTEWSSAWGSPEAQWFATIFPRIHSFIPANSILEIATGFGRWTSFLLPFTGAVYRGVDLAQNCIDHCSATFDTTDIDCKFFANDGYSLECVFDDKFDFVFSFDSLVHASIDVLDGYIRQLLETLLTDEGVAFLHHSNMKDSIARNFRNNVPSRHARDMNVAADDVVMLVERYGGKILFQEKHTWGQDVLIDCMTCFSKKNAQYKPKEIVSIDNFDFDQEMMYAKKVFHNYSCFK